MRGLENQGVAQEEMEFSCRSGRCKTPPSFCGHGEEKQFNVQYSRLHNKELQVHNLLTPSAACSPGCKIKGPGRATLSYCCCSRLQVIKRHRYITFPSRYTEWEMLFPLLLLLAHAALLQNGLGLMLSAAGPRAGKTKTASFMAIVL